jgi:D-alanyl-lipoteichoic acid acyltransferase DltB (MBOAT superfamily)
MVFNSLTFLVFFAVVLLLHHLPFSWTVKKFNLLVASYLFYAAWNPPFVLLLMLAAVVDFHLARRISRSDSPRVRRLLLIFSITLNLGLLSYFKYGQFLLENFVHLLKLGGVDYHPAASSIVLPLGISFYTFETISYLVDVYRRRIDPWDSFLDYALFLTFFPHLVAGPIVRADDFLPQCRRPRRASANQIGWGLVLLLVGLFEKVVLADGLLAPVADAVFGANIDPTFARSHAMRFAEAWIGTLAFSGQIFFDFAGYSTCGIGAALCLGFVLKDNFRFPYAAVGFSDFWQRWHISLSSWLRDYLYIPLGGNRRGRLRTGGNLMATMLLGGLWHGAAWRFVAWGGLHGAYLIGERGLKAACGGLRLFRWPGVQVLLGLLTFLLVSITWVFFRAHSFGDAFYLVGQMFQPDRHFFYLAKSTAVLVLVVMALVLAGQWLLRDSSLERAAQRIPWWACSAGLALLAVCLFLWQGEDRAFIYFQF